MEAGAGSRGRGGAGARATEIALPAQPAVWVKSHRALSWGTGTREARRSTVLLSERGSAGSRLCCPDPALARPPRLLFPLPRTPFPSPRQPAEGLSSGRRGESSCWAWLPKVRGSPPEDGVSAQTSPLTSPRAPALSELEVGQGLGVRVVSARYRASEHW